MATSDLKDNKVTLAQAIGFAITILIFIIGGWVSINSRVSVLESQQTDFENANKILFKLQSDMSEIKTSLKYIEMKQKENSDILHGRRNP